MVPAGCQSRRKGCLERRRRAKEEVPCLPRRGAVPGLSHGVEQDSPIGHVEESVPSAAADGTAVGSQCPWLCTPDRRLNRDF